jgi:hypothetical protein
MPPLRLAATSIFPQNPTNSKTQAQQAAALRISSKWPPWSVQGRSGRRVHSRGLWAYPYTNRRLRAPEPS